MTSTTRNTNKKILIKICVI